MGFWVADTVVAPRARAIAAALGALTFPTAGIEYALAHQQAFGVGWKIALGVDASRTLAVSTTRTAARTTGIFGALGQPGFCVADTLGFAVSLGVIIPFLFFGATVFFRLEVSANVFFRKTLTDGAAIFVLGKPVFTCQEAVDG